MNNFIRFAVAALLLAAMPLVIGSDFMLTIMVFTFLYLI